MYVEGEQIVYVVWTNTDLTEGRGMNVPLYVTYTPETAERMGRNLYIQGSHCPVTEELAVKIDGKWFGPVHIYSESINDHAKRMKREEEERKQELKEKAIERAREAGLSDEEIEALKY